MAKDSLYHESEYLKKQEALSDDEHILVVFYKHPFGLIVIYLFMIFGLAGSLLLLGLLLPDSIKQSDSAYSLFSGIVIITVLLVGLLLLLITHVYRSTKLIVTNKGIEQILQKALFQRKVMRFSLADIEDVTSDQKGILANAMNYGTLTIETAGELINPTFDYCPNPNRVCQIILQAKDDLLHGSGQPNNPILKD